MFLHLIEMVQNFEIFSEGQNVLTYYTCWFCPSFCRCV